MKTINKLLQLLALFAIIFAGNSFSMRMTEAGKKYAQSYVKKMQKPWTEQQLQQERKKQYQPGKYFMYEQGTSEGILIDQKLAKTCKSIAAMVEDLGEEPNEIPLNCPIYIIELVFNILEHTIYAIALSLEELVEVANVFNYLDVPQDKMDVILNKIKIEMDSVSDQIVHHKALQKLHPDLQKLLMVEPSIGFLKSFIIKKYAQKRKKVLKPFEHDSVSTAGFSHDGKKIVVGSYGNATNNLILYDISDPNNIISYPLAGHTNTIYSVTFSYDDKKIISGSGGDQDNLILYDISDLHNITYQSFAKPLIDYDYISIVAFSPDGNTIVSASSEEQNNFKLWDISNPATITYKPITGLPGFVRAEASDGKKVISGSSNINDNLILWDITNPDHITSQPLTGLQCFVNAVAISSNGKKVIAGSSSVGGNLIVADISDLNHITYQSLVGKNGFIGAVASNFDGTIIASGFSGTNDNLVVWITSDPHHITHQSLGDLQGERFDVNTVALTPDGKKMVSSFRGKLIFWTLLTDQEESLLHQLKQYNADQIRLIYQLCLKGLNEQTVTLQQDSNEQKIFMTLPQDMQNLLTDLLLGKGKGWFSGWW